MPFRCHRRSVGRARANLVVVATVVLLGLTSCLPGDRYTFHGGALEPVKAAPPLDLTDQFGQPFSLETADEKVRLIYFGYTVCLDYCPMTLTDFLAVKEGLGDQADRVQFVLVTVDPERDTEERLRDYLGFFDPDFLGLRGDSAQTETVLRGYGVFAQRSEQPDSAAGYVVDHSTTIYVLDAKGNLRLTYPFGTDPMDMTSDVRHLLDE